MDTDPQGWPDWKWHLRNQINTIEQLSEWIELSEEEKAAIKESEAVYKWRITPYYASLMHPQDRDCPIRMQAVPSVNEMVPDADAEYDPVGDRFFRKTNRVVHKYPDRVILLVTSLCPTYCRHCTRKYHTTQIDGTYFGEGEASSFDEDFRYIAAHPEIRDVLLTGGDPLMYSDEKLEYIIRNLRSIPHVEIVRIGTRFPVLLPQRITPALCAMLEQYHPIWLNTHFNHPKEITEAAAKSCDLLMRHGIPVQNQTVLLKGINDNIETLRALFLNLLKIRVRPYYLYHCDNVKGVSHFVTTLKKGREVFGQLLGNTTGFASPQYIITTKYGKIPLTGGYAVIDDNALHIENYKGEKAVITDHSLFD